MFVISVDCSQVSSIKSLLESWKQMIYLLFSFRPYLMHDSPSILLVRSGHYHKNVSSMRTWYQEKYDNWTVVDGERNHWHVWHETQSVALHTAIQIQQYLIRITEGNIRL